MSFFSATKLMTYTPEQALMIAINDATGLSLNPNYVSVGESVVQPDNTLTVSLFAKNALPNSEEFRFINLGTVTVERIDIAGFFDGQFALPYDGAISSLDAARIITDRTGILFDERDFLETVITADKPQLVVSPRSLRWVGELPIVNR